MLRLTLREAALGTQREVIVRALRRCVECNGVGARPGSRITSCAVCRGEGQVARFPGGCSGVSRHPPCILPAHSARKHFTWLQSMRKQVIRGLRPMVTCSIAIGYAYPGHRAQPPSSAVLALVLV